MSNVLVSIIVATYNSSRFIVETLSSIYKQSWENIELIITDDCSRDDTVNICQDWIDKNGNRFVRAEVLISEINTGVSANANRGLKAAKGEWIKFIGADDTLFPDCISNNMEFVADNPDVKVLFSKVDVYLNDFNKDNLLYSTPSIVNRESILWYERSAEMQYKMLLVTDRIHFSPSVFISNDILLSVGGFDDRFRLLEDYPLWLKLTKAGFRLNYMDKKTVNYRRHSNAINNTGISYIVNPNYFKQEEFRKIYTYPYLPGEIYLNQRYTWFVTQVFRMSMLNRKNKLNILIYNLLTIYLNPFRYLLWLRGKSNKTINKNLNYN